MKQQPLRTLNDSYALERACAVCGESALAVVHVEDLPDYVSCGSCNSAFILSENREWVLFGSISPDYPKTRQMALKNWTTLEAMRIMASSERRPKQEAVAAPTPPFGIGNSSRGSVGENQTSTPPFGFSEMDEIMEDASNGNGDLIREHSIEEAADTAEPEPGSRFVVRLTSNDARFPDERCAHCLRRPAPKKAQISTETRSYEIPVCQSCYSRAREGQEERRTSKLVAHLGSILVAALMIVGGIAIGQIDVQEFDAVDFLILATLGMVGYGIPLIFLLGRNSRIPITEDAKFVLSTLRVREGEGISFAWRNRGYAELFSSANKDLMEGKLVREFEP